MSAPRRRTLAICDRIPPSSRDASPAPPRRTLHPHRTRRGAGADWCRGKTPQAVAQGRAIFADAEKLKPEVRATSDGESFCFVGKDTPSPKRWIASLHGAGFSLRRAMGVIDCASKSCASAACAACAAAPWLRRPRRNMYLRRLAAGFAGRPPVRHATRRRGYTLRRGVAATPRQSRRTHPCFFPHTLHFGREINHTRVQRLHKQLLAPRRTIGKICGNL